ncbi:MAG: 50S ribosomal protein L3 [Bacillota bacterium]|nr:50S ribosomal protein L3 [Bacillota bacterium]REJ36443.1 MAG: 50S ribosomal protein L3 [Bacillota bacterium]
MPKGILGKKIGMTQIFDESGHAVPVTVIEAGPCVVVQKRTVERDGYTALQLGFGEVPEKRVNKPMRGHFKAAGVKPVRYLREVRVREGEEFANLEVGSEIKADVFSAGEYVDVIGVTKGKGFAGTIKRHNFNRGPMSHGSMYHRRVGSLGPQGPQRVIPGRRMPGRMGGERRTIQGLKVVRVDADRNLILVRGSVPGPRGSLVLIRETVKHKS